MGPGKSRWELVVSDPSPESLLNDLMGLEVGLGGAVPVDGVTLSFSVEYDAIRRVRALVDSRGSRVLLCRPVGTRPVLRRLSRRRVLLVSLVVCLVLLGCSNLFVWRMEVTGCETVPAGRILRCMQEAGAGIGSFWPGFDSEALRSRLLLEIPELHWAGINYRSGAVEIIVRERREPPEIVDNDAPVHITATRDGVITAITAKQGETLVGVGDGVTKGQVLVSGAVQSSMGTRRPAHALGQVTARTWHSITAVQPATETEKRYTGKKTWKIAVIFGSKRLNFYSGSSISHTSCDKIIMEYHLRMDGVFTLPVRVVTEQTLFWTAAPRDLTLEEQEERARTALMEVLAERLDGRGTVTMSHFADSPRDGGMTVTLMAECTEDIGEETPFQWEVIPEDNTFGEETTND